MGKNRLDELIEESIALEHNVAALYQTFSETLPEDSDFWWQLHLEEKSHALLIRAAKESFAKRGKFPYDMVADSIEDLKNSNVKIKGLIGHCQANPPTRSGACKIAIALENNAGEIHYTQFMERDAGNPVEAVFQQLNRDDNDHERRIQKHLDALTANA